MATGIDRIAGVSAVFIVLSVIACGQQRSAEPRIPPAGDPVPAFDTDGKADSASSANDGDEDSIGSTGDTPIFDVGNMPEGPELTPGCGAVDFLFVVDNSGSMSDDQRNLIENFPTLIQGELFRIKTSDNLAFLDYFIFTN